MPSIPRPRTHADTFADLRDHTARGKFQHASFLIRLKLADIDPEDAPQEFDESGSSGSDDESIGSSGARDHYKSVGLV